MSTFEDRFKIVPLDRESIEEENILNEISALLSKLGNESKAGRFFSADDVADILEHTAHTQFTALPLEEVLCILGEIFSDAQHSIHRSIQAQLEKASQEQKFSSLQRSIFAQMVKEPEQYAWIKTTSA